ncbi:enoyl-CoA hydratase-related protein [Streptomyces sp. NPDC005803]|uniref:enoyl-CoA hydratase-related protein n=1 Tax=Streptomyces sp. NPDC005803 TaxID=3154297 RepID=UPI00340E66DE
MRVGLVAGEGGALALPLPAAPARVKETLLLGQRVDAHDGVQLGIADRAVPQDELLAEAMSRTTNRVAARTSAA